MPTPIQDKIKEFDEKFEEEFFELHYRFCPLVDKEGQNFQEECSKNRKDLVLKIKSFLYSTFTEQEERHKGEIESIVKEVEKEREAVLAFARSKGMSTSDGEITYIGGNMRAITDILSILDKYK